jgi:O-antigen/teichoic acid export membrane protein
MIAYIIAVPFIFNLLFPQYPESIPFAQALGLLFLFIPRSVYVQVLVAHKQTKALYILSTIIPIVKLPIMFIAITVLGIWGAVYALIINGALEAIIGWYFFKTANPVDSPTVEQ